MKEAPTFAPQFTGNADVRRQNAPRELPRVNESRPSPEQAQFYNRYQAELTRAQMSERQANREARNKMMGLTAPELRKIGTKQVLWGFGLSFLDAVGGGLGILTGGLGAYGISSLLGLGAVVTSIGVVGAAGIGYVGGAVAGAELVRHIYERYARKIDTSLPPLDHSDRVLGNVLAPLTLTWTAPMVAGVRNIFDGYNNMKSIQ